MRVLELFCGTKSFTKVAEARGHECRTLDNDARFNPTYCMDIMDFKPEMLNGWHPDVIWASPPCQCFSVMVISKNWEKKRIGKNPQPKREEAIKAMAIAQRTTEIIKELTPTYYFIENPRAMLRKMAFMRGWHHSTVTYCKYGLDYQKATDIWNNCYEWRPRAVCSPGDPCHVRAPRGSHEGLQGIGRIASHRAVLHPSEMSYHYKGKQRDSLHPFDIKQETGWGKAAERAIVPSQLCEEILIACEKAEKVGGGKE
jgi:hypothetical protein